MSSDSELKILVRGIIRTSPNGRMHLVELMKDFQTQEYESLSSIIGRKGYETAADWLSSCPEFKVYGKGFHTVIEVVESETNTLSTHIAELSKSKEKCSGYLKIQEGTDSKRFLDAADDVSDDSSDSEFSTGVTLKYKELAPIKPTPATLVKTVDKIVHSSIPLEEEEFIDQIISIQILDSFNPHRFWFIKCKEIIELKFLINQMRNFYTDNDALINQEELLKGLHVAVFYSGAWRRSEILKVWPQQMARVHFVDFGTVDDVALRHIRFLAEEFLTPPSFAHRGTLSHIQPLNGVWSKESESFFKENFVHQKFDAKVYQKNDEDSSYYLALKSKEENGKDQVLISNILIQGGFCDVDRGFLERGVEGEMSFFDIEQGKHLKDPQMIEQDSWLPDAKLQKPSDDWLPSAPVSETSSPKDHGFEKNLLAPGQSRTSQIKTRKLKPLKVPSYKHSSYSSNTSIITQFNALNITGNQTRSHHTIADDKRSTSPEKPKRQIAEQSLRNIQAGNIKKIYIHVVNSREEFYFYLKDEFVEIREFLKEFNAAYEDKAVPNEDFGAGNDVVIFTDGNYCRARIMKSFNNGESFQVFLLDFGYSVERAKEEIFQLHEKWLHQQSAVYKGQLALAPEHVDIRSRLQFATMVTDRFINVKVSRIHENDKLELLLLD